MKKLYFTFLTLLTAVCAGAQTLQTYKGVFESGTATYQYFENEQSDRIYDGTFNYAGNPYTITGKFSKNQRIGKWKIAAVNKVYKNEKSKVQLNTTVAGQYKNGSMDSTWTYSNAIKTFNPKTKKFAAKPEKTISVANFADNHFVGKITYEKGVTAKTTVSGQFNSAGFPDGLWTIKSAKEVEELRYKDGVLLSRIVKDPATGDKKVNEDFNVFVSDFAKNYDAVNMFATINGKMYFADTVDFQNMATQVWQNDVIVLDGFGNLINPLYAYKRSQMAPLARYVKFIECDGNTDCFSNYMKKKKAEEERINKEKAAEAERLRTEALAKEELERIEREKELERQRLEQLANAERIGDEFFNQRKFKSALNQYTEVSKMGHNDKLATKIMQTEREIIKIDSLHSLKKANFESLNARVASTFESAYALEPAVKAKKKVYGVNYKAAIDYLKTNFMPQFETLKASMTEQNNTVLESWTNDDQRMVDEINILKKQLDEVSRFYDAVNDAVTNNNKAKLRVLNSSLNPKNIIYDMINYKAI
ncbi:MAG: hypothetical protein K0R65_1653 [Crocinitomicaceae bacterium]|jgi:hypothetical protein|nr:hypothetical protein [Crocinitomicaceae bacterium]